MSARSGRKATTVALAAALLSSLLGAGRSAAEGIRFRDVTEKWGIDFRHRQAGTGEYYMPESMGSGVVVFDHDGDGDQDLLMVDGGSTPGYEEESPRTTLYRNDGEGRFVDVTERSGIVVMAYGMGGTAGDVDGDGDLDLFVSQFGANQLFLNDGDGTFSDVTATSGLGAEPELWSTSSGFGDTDGDGYLDLYVANYVDFTWDNNPACGLKSQNLRSYCHPDVYDGQPDRLYRNRGDGTFADVTAAAGLEAATGKGLGVIFGDLDLDGWTDLYVANDMTANFLFRNRGDGGFEDLALLSGTAFSDLGNPESGMGIGLGDLDGNGYEDLVVTHLDLQTTAVYANMGDGIFLDQRFQTLLAEPSMFKVGFGIVLGDLDLDGDLDLVIANGHIVHNVEEWGTGTTYRQRNQCFENTGGGRFREVADVGFEAVRAGRGLAAGDLDGDGDLDLAVNNLDEEPEIYENVTGGDNAWLQIDLRGPGPNVHGIGARLEAATPSGRQSREVRTACSYLSQSAITAHLGLGDAASIDQLTVTWPGGAKQTFRGLPASRRLLIRRSTEP